MTIPLVDLKAQYAALKPEMDAAIANILTNTSFIGGKPVRAFEEAFAAYCETRYAIGLANGTDAIQLALLAAGVTPGDEVITVAHTFTATAEGIVNIGARPVFVDVDETATMAVDAVAARITPRTRVILPVDLYGQPADLDPLMALAEQHGLLVVEDAAQAHGARYKGRRAGSLAHMATFSFYPGKNLGAYGDAGALTTDDPTLAGHVRMLHDHGRTDKYIHARVGWNSRLDALQAAVLGVKLPHLDEWNAARRRHAALYDRLLADVPGVVTPHVGPDREPVYHLYVIAAPHRERVQAALRAAGVETGIHYPVPLHEQPAYAYLGYAPEDLPRSRALGPRILSLPMYAELTDAQIRTVVDVIAQELARGD